MKVRVMTKPTLGILGAGKLGITLANIGIKSGYKINISGSGDPRKIALSVNILANGALPLSNDDVIKNSDVIILAMPLSKYKTIKPQSLAGKLVIDAMNYWWEIDGTQNKYYDEKITSSEAVQDYFKDSHLVKAFNHMGYHDLAQEADNKLKVKAIAYVGNNQEANNRVADIISDFGFEPYFLGELKNSKVLQPGEILFGVDETKDGIKKILNKKSTE